MNLFSLISLFSYFAFFAKGYPLPVKAAYLKYGGRPQSQPTRCGHTLTRCPLPGLAGACRPSTPHKSQRQERTCVQRQGAAHGSSCASPRRRKKPLLPRLLCRDRPLRIFCANGRWTIVCDKHRWRKSVSGSLRVSGPILTSLPAGLTHGKAVPKLWRF